MQQKNGRKELRSDMKETLISYDFAFYNSKELEKEIFLKKRVQRFEGLARRKKQSHLV